MSRGYGWQRIAKQARAARIAEILKRGPITQTQLAKRLGVSTAQVRVALKELPDVKVAKGWDDGGLSY